MPYRETPTDATEYQKTSWLGRLRLHAEALAYVVGAAMSFSMGMAADAAAVVAVSAIAVLFFFIFLLVATDREEVRPILNLFGSTVVTSAVLLALGWYQEPPPPTVEQQEIERCEIKLEAVENALRVELSDGNTKQEE